MKKLFIVLLLFASLGFSQTFNIDYEEFFKRPLAASNILPAYDTGKYLTNDGSTLSWGTVSFVGYLRANGADPLTADWLGNSYQISRLIPVLALTNGATQIITAAQCQNYVIHNGSCDQAIHIDLPAAVVGKQCTVYVAAAFAITIDPNLTDQIIPSTSTAGDYLTSGAVIGTAISMVCLQTGKWYVAGKVGDWTEE